MKRDWKRVILRGLGFQSVLVGGGYGTGAEIGRYFGRQGLWGGLLGLGVTALVWGVLCGLSFDFARVFRAWDYGSMLTLLLGPWALFYDLCYAAMALFALTARPCRLREASGERQRYPAARFCWCYGERKRWRKPFPSGPTCCTGYICCFC